MHHIGIITASIELDSALYSKLGYDPLGGVIEDSVQNNLLFFMKNHVSGEILELIEPLNENSTVINLPKGYAHICYEVSDLDGFIAAFKQERLGVVFTESLPATAFSGRRIAFAMLKNKTLIELLEADNGELP